MKIDETAASASVYEFGEYQLDARRRVLLRQDGTVVPLTARVFDTLRVLVENAGRLVDKRELMRSVWGETIVEENNLTQAVSSLRQALGEKPDDHQFVVTIPGRGYQFIAEVRTVAVPTPAEHTEARRPSGRRLTITLVLLLTLAAASYFLVLLPQQRDGPEIRTLAILPFMPLVAETRDPALEFGMADTLITRLSQGTGLVVRPLSSVRRYAGLDQDSVAAGRALEVDAVLDGSIHRAGESLRISVRLVRVQDGVVLWADQIDESWTDIFDVQDRLAERVAGAMTRELTPAARARLTRRETAIGEAYRYYLLGRFHYLKLVPPEIDKGIAYLRQAVELDPDYAAAWAALAEAHRALAITSDRRPADVLPLGKAAALKAIELDGNLDSAAASLCFIQVWWDRDWRGAERSCRRSLAINPDSPDGHRAYAVLLSDLARHDEAIASARRAVELEPLSLITRAIEGHVLHYAGRNDEALVRLRSTLELENGFWIAHLLIGKVYLEQGKLEEALAAFEKARELSGANSETVSLIGFTHARRQDRKSALQALSELSSRAHYVPPFNIAMIYNGLGNREITFEWLEKAYADRDVRLTFLKVERKWDSLRSDERFRSLARRLELE